MVHSCLHKKRKELLQQKMQKADRADDFLVSLSVTSVFDPSVKEDSDASFLEDYGNLRSALNSSRSHDTSSKQPRKQVEDKSTNTDSAHTWRHRQEPKKKYRKKRVCKIHGPQPSPRDHKKKAKMPENQITTPFRSQTTTNFRQPTHNASSVYSYAADGYTNYEVFPKIVEMSKVVMTYLNDHPRVAVALLVLTMFWWIWLQIDFCISHVLASVFRLGRPTAHWLAVTVEQTGRKVTSFATSADELIEAFYCDFSRSWCRRFQLMCEVKCSFVEQTIQRIRAKP